MVSIQGVYSRERIRMNLGKYNSRTFLPAAINYPEMRPLLLFIFVSEPGSITRISCEV